MKRIVLLIALAISFSASAQEGNRHQCLTDVLSEQLSKSEPQLAKQMQTHMDNLVNYTPSRSKKATKYVIPVVFHIIHNYGPENISKAQIEDQIRVLNEDFSRTNADASKTRSQFLGVAADMEVEFRLATIDPDGNCTDGIVRVFSEETYGARDNVKQLSRWPNDKYMNVWVVSSIRDTDNDPNTTTLGFAYLPGFMSIGDSRDGIVVVADRVGTIGTSSTAKAGRTLTHEVGHYLGLLHPFQGGCGSSCSSTGDRICDTPPVEDPSFGCNTNRVSCGVTTQIENFMDYANGNCQNMFTNGQKAFVEYYFTQTPRKQLISASNLIATGTNDGAVANLCKPKADFNTTYRAACSNTSVYFTDESWGGEGQDWLWTFEGGTPSTSMEKDPSVMYENPGNYKVTLKVTNAAGSDQVTKSAYITVKPGVAPYKGHIVQGFESPTFATDGEPWITEYEKDESFIRVTNTAHLGNACYKANNNATTPAGTKFTFVSPTVDISAYEGLGPKISFYYAYAKRTETDVDIFRVYISTNCGRTWIQRAYRTGSLLATVDGTKFPFTPTEDDWDLLEVDLSSFDDATNLAVKFELESKTGSALYIDDININPFTSSVPTISKDVLSLNVYPNPSSGSSKITYYLDASQTVTLELYDTYGKKVSTLVNSQKQPAGSYEYTVNKEATLPSGIYFVKINVGMTYVTQKLVVLGDN